MPYCDDFWHVDAHENILSPTCLTVFVKSKTENQLITFVIAYLVADNNVKCETVAATRDRSADFITQNYGLLTVLTLILWITGYVEYYSNVFIVNLLKTEH